MIFRYVSLVRPVLKSLLGQTGFGPNRGKNTNSCDTVATIPTPKTGPLFISTYQRPYEVEIGRPNAANYYLTFSSEK
jgi:hypothetical protein